MTSEEAYIKFLQKVNKNYTNDNISVDKSRFVQIFNESQNKFVEWTIEKKNEDDIRRIQKLVVLDKKLTEKGKFEEHQNFELPSDYFEFSSAKAFASKGECTNKRIHLFERKHENIEELLIDKFSKPSFEFRETLYTIGGDSINVYKGDFKITRVLLSYYRRPKVIDIDGYIKIDGSPSTNLDPEFNDEIVDRILSVAAKEFNINSDNYNRLQIDKDRVVTDF